MVRAMPRDAYGWESTVVVVGNNCSCPRFGVDKRIENRKERWGKGEKKFNTGRYKGCTVARFEGGKIQMGQRWQMQVLHMRMCT